jgi:hypothetical protein
MTIDESIAEINKGLYPSRLTKEGEESVRQRLINEQKAFELLVEKNKSIEFKPCKSIYCGSGSVRNNGDGFSPERQYRGF